MSTTLLTKLKWLSDLQSQTRRSAAWVAGWALTAAPRRRLLPRGSMTASTARSGMWRGGVSALEDVAEALHSARADLQALGLWVLPTYDLGSGQRSRIKLTPVAR